MINMAKRRKRKDSKKALTMGDLFEIKVTPITDKKFEKQYLYHIKTNKCPYNKKECDPENCPFGENGMEQCPIHGGDEY